MIIQVEKPTLRRKEMDGVLQTMADEVIGVGTHTKLFEQAFREFTNLEGSTIALRSGFDALTLALKALDLKENSVVAISALTPSWYIEALNSLNLKSLILDIELETYSIDPQFIPSNVDAILMYHPYGNFPLKEGFENISIPIIEDITHSLASFYDDGDKPGTIGSIVIATFEEGSIVSTGGGAIVHTNNEEYQKHLETLTDPLINIIGLPNLNGALGVVQFQNINTNLESRRAIYSRFEKALMRTKHSLFKVKGVEFITNASSFVVTMEAKRDQGQKFALKHEIETTLAFENCVLKDNLEDFKNYPNAIPIILRSIRFPLYPFLSKNQIEQIERVVGHLP